MKQEAGGKDVVIIGGGIIGCAIANQLATHGFKVAVLEKGELGQEASSAAAGMLAPFAEAAHSVPKALADLFEASHAMYSDFVAGLEAETGIQIGHQRNGSLLLATDYQEAKMLAGLLERQLAAGTTIESLTCGELTRLQPGLSPEVQSALFFREDQHINNRRLVKALVTSAVARGVTFLTGTPALEVVVEGTKVRAIRTPMEEIACHTAINCAGAWSGNIGPVPPAVRPIRGQIVELQLRPQFLQHLVHAAGCYVVPWPDGRTLVGSTMENVGYCKTVTAGGILDLLSAAARVIPKLKSATLQQTWAGLRPDTSDNLPILGRTRIANYIMATGHFRNGILLTPLTAELISKLVISEKASLPQLAPFSPERFEAGFADRTQSAGNAPGALTRS